MTSFDLPPGDLWNLAELMVVGAPLIALEVPDKLDGSSNDITEISTVLAEYALLAQIPDVVVRSDRPTVLELIRAQDAPTTAEN